MGDASNTLRILVATDCHLGYMEKDEIRRHDSFQAFEEICSIAEQKQVEFLLLGGDLFHENKPSRSTLVKAIEILRRHCLNDRPVQFEVVSDQTVNFHNVFGRVKYEDPNFNVGLPVFSIHGNHDDPAGVDNLSAVDILSACNLVNYFGKTVLGGCGVGQINVYPILIKKGSTAVALYGLGNIRDERLNRMFQTPHAVQWMRPESQEGCQVSDWFNILVLHQNRLIKFSNKACRVKANPKNAINEHLLPRFLDFIVWGHEHECLIDPQEVPGMGFHISQPGSSVATSLIDGESKPKHALLLEIKGNRYRPTKIPLTSVRPFEYTGIVLKDEPDIDPNDQNSVLEHLDKLVEKLLEKSSKKAVNRAELKLPLIRIQVDYSGFMTINPQRFRQKYVGKVANPQDILIFSKSTRREKGEGKIDDSELLRPEELNQQTIEALVTENNLKTEILPVNDLGIALHKFVDKDDKMAFYYCVKNNLDETRNKIAKDLDPVKFEGEDLIVKVGECLEERVRERSIRGKDPTQFTYSAQPSEELQTRSAAGLGDSVSFSDDEDAMQISSSKPRTRGRKGSYGPSQTPSRGRGRGRGSARGRGSSCVLVAAFISTSLGGIASGIVADDDSASSEKHEVEEIDDSSENGELPGRKRAASKGPARASNQASKRGRKSDNSSIHKMFMNNDNNDDDDEDNIRKKLNNLPPVTKNYGALRR